MDTTLPGLNSGQFNKHSVFFRNYKRYRSKTFCFVFRKKNAKLSYKKNPIEQYFDLKNIGRVIFGQAK